MERIGADHYRDACVSARRDAEREDFGHGSLGNDDSSLTPHEVSDELWDLNASVRDKLELFFEIYDEMPASGLLMYVSHHYPAWPSSVKRQFWDGVRTRFGGADRALARPLAYYLWCDWFEHGDFTREAWEALTTVDTPRVALQEVLIASGPVPWSMKTELYERLISDQRWHYYIYRSLLHSAFDIFGKIDHEEASAWLSRLAIPDSTDHLSELAARLRNSSRAV